MRLLCVIFAMLAGPAIACGPDTDCVIGDRTYRIVIPYRTDEPLGLLMFAHGYRGSAAGAMNNTALRRLASDMDMVFVAIKSAEDDWDLANRPSEPDQAEAAEYEYIEAVLADVRARVNLDDDRMILTGFSAGGMMTWTIACGMSEAFTGYIPVSGTFWDPVPESCPTPARSVVHIHGDSDGTVPLAGRAIGQTRQGVVRSAVEMYRDLGAFVVMGEVEAAGGMRCELAENEARRVMDFCLFEGGHSFSVERVRWAVERILGSA